MKLSSSILATLFLLLTTQIFGQRMEALIKQVTKAELEITTYNKDPLAEAYVIFDTGKTTFVQRDDQLAIQYIRTAKIKILNTEGVKHAEISVPLYLDSKRVQERLVRVEAYSYNLEGTEIVTTTFDDKEIFEEIINNSWIRKKFVIPNVKEGSVIEYRYVMETPFIFNLPDWNFQHKIPVSYSEYSVSVVPFYEYQFILQGAAGFDFRETKKEKGLERSVYGVNFNDLTTVVAIKDLPAFRDESYISSMDDYRVKLDFQLSRIHRPGGSKTDIMTTWPDLRKEYLSHNEFGNFIRKSRKPAEKILESRLALSERKPAEKIQKIIDFAKTEFKWNEFYGKFTTQSPKNLLSKKSGNVADINLFTIALLRAAGIDAYPVIISSRGHGKIETGYPFASFFNYVIIQVKIKGGILLTDATDKMIAFNRLPPRCINDKGLVINDAETEEWLYTHSEAPSKTKTMIKMTPDPTQEQLSIEVIRQKTELDAYAARQRSGNNTEKLKEKLLEEHFNSIGKIKIKNYDNLRAPFTIAFQGEVDQEKLNDQLVISPFLHYPPAENYFMEPNRAYAIDFLAPNFENFKTEIIIPEGYEVAYLPEPLDINDKTVTINTNYKTSQNSITVTANLNFNMGIYDAKYYRLLKTHIDKAVASFNEKIILQPVE